MYVLSELLLSILAFVLAWVSLGVMILIATDQSRIRKASKQEKIKRRHMAISKLQDIIFLLELDLEWYEINFDITYQSMTEEELGKLKEIIQVYYTDLNSKEIQDAEEIMYKTKLWLDHPVYEKDLTVTQKVTLIGSTYEDIVKKINQLNNLLTETNDDLKKTIS